MYSVMPAPIGYGLGALVLKEWGHTLQNPRKKSHRIIIQLAGTPDINRSL